MNLAKVSPMLFLAGAFAAATVLEPKWSEFNQQQSNSVLQLALGDGRRLFANYFITKADVYFHQGYYPSVFDQKPKREESHAHETEEEHAAHATHEEHADHDAHEKEMDFLGESHNWIDEFGRHFFVSKHTHMANAEARELLPWFRVAAELDPNQPEVYTTASFWLRGMGKFQEAEEFLRKGWRENPDSYEILLELGRIYETNRGDAIRARNVWELGLQKWQKVEGGKEHPDLVAKQAFLAHLADLEEKVGHNVEAIAYLEQLVNLSPNPDFIKKRITDLKAKDGN